MRSRREFVSGASVILLVAPVLARAIAACSSENDTPPSCDGAESTSSVVQMHAHVVCVSAALLAHPPAEGAMIATTPASGHQHAIALTSAELAKIASNERVTVTTSVAQSHTHDFSITRAGRAPAPTRPARGTRGARAPDRVTAQRRAVVSRAPTTRCPPKSKRPCRPA